MAVSDAVRGGVDEAVLLLLGEAVGLAEEAGATADGREILSAGTRVCGCVCV